MLLEVSSNVFNIGNIKFSSAVVDSIIIIIYTILYFGKRYDYSEKKSIVGITCIIGSFTTFGIFVFKNLFGNYHMESSTIPNVYIKLILGIFISMWSVYSSEFLNNTKSCECNGLVKKILLKISRFKEQLKYFVVSLIIAFKNMEVTWFDYLALGIIGALPIVNIFNLNYNYGFINFIGIHEIINNKRTKGIAYMLIGQIFILIETLSKNSIINILNNMIYLIYLIIFIIDLCIQTNKMRKLRVRKVQNNVQ
ncbi:hypothetical protein [Clostridium sp. VAP23]|uniref:hypothetical protein n=1 Tax=Clostridium sp. VAP23 TaxID=2949981 RepID=UPI002079BD4E|nr:hypothetical protein [Clostridium sp. VAP23]